MTYTPPPGYPEPPTAHAPRAAHAGGPSGAGAPPLAGAAIAALALAVAAMGAERFAYYGTRTSLYLLSSGDGVPLGGVYTVAALFTTVGVLVGGPLAYALGARLTGLVGALVAAAGCLACAGVGVWGYAAVAFGSGVFRVVPLAVMLEEVPPTGARFRRVAAAVATGYAVVDAAAFASTGFGTLGARLGVAWALGLAALPFAVAAALSGVLLGMGPRKHLQTDERLEIAAGPSGDPYRGGPAVHAVGGAPLNPGLLVALLAANVVVSLASALPYYPRAVPGGALFHALDALVSMTASVALGAVLATTALRARAAHLFGAALAVFAAGTVLRALPPLGPLSVLFQLVLTVGHALVAALGVAAFAPRAPRRLGALAVALWALVPSGLGLLLRALPLSRSAESPWMAAAVVALGLVAGAGAVGMVVFGERLQPGQDP